MLRVAGLGNAIGAGATGPEGVLVELRGCRLLVGCPLGTAADLARLGVKFGDLDAVLLTCARSLSGWPELLPTNVSLASGFGSRPRLLGTSPLLLAAEAHLQDLIASGCAERGFSLTHSQLSEALSGAEEVHFQQEVTIQGPDGPILASPVSSGYCLGGSYWVLEAHGVRAAILGPASVAAPLAPLPLDVSPLKGVSAMVLHGITTQVSAAEQSTALPRHLAAAADEVAGILQAGGCVLIPMGADMPLALDLVEALGTAIAKLPATAQAPILVVGAPTRLLQRCGSFAEWSHPDRAARAHAGRSPFAVEALLSSHRLALAESVPGLADSFREPCVVLAYASPSEGSPFVHFRSRWSEQDASRLLMIDATAVAPSAATAAPLMNSASSSSHRLRPMGSPMDMRLQPDEVKALLLDAAPSVAVLPASTGIMLPEGSGISATADLCRGRRISVQVDLRVPSARCWLSAAAVAVAEAALLQKDVCHFDGVLLGHKRPLILPSEPPAKHQRGHERPPLLAGKVDVDAFIRVLAARGHVAHLAPAAKGRPIISARGVSHAATEVEEVAAPSLGARVRLNGPGREGGFETTIEATSRHSRQLITEILESLLDEF